MELDVSGKRLPMRGALLSKFFTEFGHYPKAVIVANEAERKQLLTCWANHELTEEEKADPYYQTWRGIEIKVGGNDV